MKLRPWDTAAGALIVEEAGGRLSDLAGNKFSISGKETLASNGAIHDELVNTALAATLARNSLTRS
jgi:myo-inositol-1(or 4)-monophosphatase